jgi:uncharacterized protein YndB with AHSA1/START domain
MKSEAIDSRYAVVTGPGTLRMERLLPGPIERVWSFLTESEKRGKWLASGPMDLRIGGGVTLVFDHDTLTPHDEPRPQEYGEGCEKGSTHTGHVRECDPPRLLTFTWDESSGFSSVVTFELSEQGDNVLMVLTHRQLGDNPEVLTSVSAGWHTHTGILISVLKGETPAPFWSTHLRLQGAYKRIHFGG